MWLNNLRINDKKSLSPVEFLVLANCVSGDYLSAQQILAKINNQFSNWSSTAGTIYPILHRLTDLLLLEKDENSKLSFKISNKGAEFFISTLHEFEDHFELTSSFFKSIIQAFITVDPIQSRKLLDSFQMKTDKFKGEIKNMEKEAELKKVEDNWTEVKVDF